MHTLHSSRIFCIQRSRSEIRECDPQMSLCPIRVTQWAETLISACKTASWRWGEHAVAGGACLAAVFLLPRCSSSLPPCWEAALGPAAGHCLPTSGENKFKEGSVRREKREM